MSTSLQFDGMAALVKEVQETESRYLLHGDRHDKMVTPWMPYQPADFIGIMWECMPELKGDWFLDVGCGPGTKMQIAHELFGLKVTGIEIDKEMAAEANKRIPPWPVKSLPAVFCGDALESAIGSYHAYDIIWLYRPFRSAMHERTLEEMIIRDMKPGAILAGGSWETAIPMLGWNPIVDDCLYDPQGGPGQIFRGAWQKPME